MWSKLSKSKFRRTKSVKQSDSSGIDLNKGQEMFTANPRLIESTKNYLEAKYSKIKNDTNSRIDRNRQLEEKLSSSLNMSSQEKISIRSHFHLLESIDIKNRLAPVNLSNFTLLKTIGKGSFGKVFLVQFESNELEDLESNIFAMKVMDKKKMRQRKQISHINTEKSALQTITETLNTSPENTTTENDQRYLVTLHYSFQDVNNLYLIMDYMPGGDLMNLLIKRNILSEEHTRVYMTQLIIAIDVLHKLGYIHRDLKPDNILINWDGTIKLSDFGLSKRINCSSSLNQNLTSKYQPNFNITDDQPQNSSNESFNENILCRERWRSKRRELAYSTVGTPDYISCEILAKKGYNRECDYWSLGVIIFECIYGYPPFSSEKASITCNKILNWKHCFRLPKNTLLQVSNEAKNLLNRLICEPCVRIGFIQGRKEFENHAWFKDIDFSTIHQQTQPFLPFFNHEKENILQTLNLPPSQESESYKNCVEKLTQYFDNFEEDENKSILFYDNVNTNNKFKRRYKIGDNDFLNFTYKKENTSQSQAFIDNIGCSNQQQHIKQ